MRRKSRKKNPPGEKRGTKDARMHTLMSNLWVRLLNHTYYVCDKNPAFSELACGNTEIANIVECDPWTIGILITFAPFLQTWFRKEIAKTHFYTRAMANVPDTHLPNQYCTTLRMSKYPALLEEYQKEFGEGFYQPCPIHERSRSGCGDMNTKPDAPVKRCYFHRGDTSEHHIGHCGHPSWIVNHDAIRTHHFRAHHMAYDLPCNYSSYGFPLYAIGIPPTVAHHRLSWPVFGRYSYLPEARWIHHLEHGGVALLYHECIMEAGLWLERFARSFDVLLIPENQRSFNGNSTFRWVVSPYPHLKSRFAAAMNGHVLIRDCANVDDLVAFIPAHYGCQRGQMCEMATTADLGLYDWLRIDAANHSESQLGRHSSTMVDDVVTFGILCWMGSRLGQSPLAKLPML